MLVNSRTHAVSHIIIFETIIRKGAYRYSFHESLEVGYNYFDINEKKYAFTFQVQKYFELSSSKRLMMYGRKKNKNRWQNTMRSARY